MLKYFLVLTSVIVVSVYGSSFQDGLIPMRGGRIVGGVNTTVKKNPWQLSIVYYGAFRCGASLILPNVVITAAHCTYTTNADSMEVRAGSTFINSGGKLLPVQKYIQHPDYIPSTYEADISIIFLKSSFITCGTVQTIQIPIQGAKLAYGQLAKVTGWGYTSEGGSISTILQTAQIPIITNKYCSQLYSEFGNNTITKNMFCAGYPLGGIDSCQGDSGGPLTFNRKLIGIVSFGFGCARAGYPSVNANVAAMSDWITKTMHQKS